MKTLTAAICLLIWLPLCTASQPHWEINNPYPTAGRITALDNPSADTCWLATLYGAVKVTDDNGQSWQSVALPNFNPQEHLLDLVNGQSGWVVDIMNPASPFGAVVFQTDNGGQSWSSTVIGSDNELFTAKCIAASGQLVIIGGSEPGAEIIPAVYRLVDNSWTRTLLPDGNGVSISDICILNGSMAWAVGNLGYCAFSADGGHNWQKLDTGTDEDLSSVAFSTPLVGWAAGGGFNSPLMLKTTNGGGSWQPVEGLPATSPYVALKTYGHAGIIAASRGDGEDDIAHLLISRDGSSWDVLSQYQNEHLYSLTVNGNAIWVGGENGLLLNSPDARSVAEVSHRVNTSQLNSISFSDPLHGWAVGNLGAVLITHNGGSLWYSPRSFPGWDCTAVLAVNSRRALVACSGSQEFLTDDGGVNWQEIAVSQSDVTKFAMKNDVIYAAAGSSVSVSRNGGEDWTESVVKEGSTILDIAAASAQVAYAALDQDSVMMTDDGGSNWHAAIGIPPDCDAVYHLDEEHGWAAGIDRTGSHLWSTRDGWTTKHTFQGFGQVTAMAFASYTEGWVSSIDAGNQFVHTKGDTFRQTPAELPVNRVIGITALDSNHVWVCGEGGMIAGYGDNVMSVPKDQVTEPVAQSLIEVWPNPTNGAINLRWNHLGEHAGLLFLTDLDGRIINTLNRPSGATTMGVDLRDLPSGSYFIRPQSRSIPGVRILLLK